MTTSELPAPGTDPDARLTATDLDGLIPTFVATRIDINIAEQANIEKATRWAFGRRLVTTPSEFLTIEFSDRLHRRMFGDVWTWAGQHCTCTTTTGVQPRWIERRLRQLFDHTIFPHDLGITAPSELAVRLHHRLLEVHAYRDGNARHARFMADLYLHIVGVPRLTWGPVHEIEATESRRRADLTALQTLLDKVTTAEATRLKNALDRATDPPT